MARRVHDIAKDLGISNKAIVDKCKAEGIPETLIKNHMSTVSAGLEATIREWFSATASHSAIETAERVDLEKVKIKPRRATKTASEDGDAPEAPAPPPHRRGGHGGRRASQAGRAPRGPGRADPGDARTGGARGALPAAHTGAPARPDR